MNKIVVADSDKASRDFCYELFIHDGHQVWTAADGEKLLEILEKENPDLVMVDACLLEKEGWDILEKIRLKQKVPVVLLVASLNAEQQKHALAAGIHEILIKGQSPIQFRDRVRELLLHFPKNGDVKNKSSQEQTLIADDDEAILRLLTFLFEKKSYRVYAATNGNEAVRLFFEHKPDVVLLDVTMPGMDGIAALKKIREKDTRACVIMVTGLQEESIAQEAMAHGAYAYVVKPFDFKRLELTVSTGLIVASSR